VTRLERWITREVEANGGRSAFRLLPTGLDAFVARAALIDVAERTLDLQYYIFHRDKTGALITDRLVAAADRGVRVRVLLDDWGTLDKKDESVADLDAHPNIDVRLFNPYTHRSGLHRLGELLTDFSASIAGCITSCSSPTASPPFWRPQHRRRILQRW
jgi:putative cardiolipin synthase